MTLITAIWEAQIRGSQLKTSLGKKGSKDLPPISTKSKLSMMVHPCKPSYIGGMGRRIMV
jgi:hypothetical protein